MRKKLFTFIGILLMLIITGCSNKKAIDTKKFIALAHRYNYDYANVYDQYSSYDFIKEATVMGDFDNWQIEFYVLSDNTSAINMFDTNKLIFEERKGYSSVYHSFNTKNSSIYSLTSNGKYMYLSRIDNTLLYVDVPVKYKDLVDGLIKEIGY